MRDGCRRRIDSRRSSVSIGCSPCASGLVTGPTEFRGLVRSDRRRCSYPNTLTFYLSHVTIRVDCLGITHDDVQTGPLAGHARHADSAGRGAPAAARVRHCPTVAATVAGSPAGPTGLALSGIAPLG